MIESIVKWVSAGDSMFANMGPILSIALAMVGGFGITQLIKFPIAGLLSDRWRDWTIRTTGIVATWFVATLIGNLPWQIDMVVAVSQPFAYRGVMGAIRKFWPWLEAGKVLGSAAPSEASMNAMRARRHG